MKLAKIPQLGAQVASQAGKAAEGFGALLEALAPQKPAKKAPRATTPAGAPEKVKPGRVEEICGKSPMKMLVMSTTLAPLGLVVMIGKLKSTLSVNANPTARSCGSPGLALKRTLRRTT